MANQDMESLSNDFAQLRKEFSKTLENLNERRGGVSAELEGRLGEIGEQISGLYHELQGKGRRGVAVIEETVEQRPLTAIMLAFAVGFIGSRLIDRR